MAVSNWFNWMEGDEVLAMKGMQRKFMCSNKSFPEFITEKLVAAFPNDVINLRVLSGYG